MTWRELIAHAESTLADAGVDSPAVDARHLADHVAGMSVLFAPEPSEGEVKQYRDLVARRAERVPLQHLTGTMYFRYLELPSTPGVFIVRPETEVLAGLAINEVRRLHASGTERPRVLDLCTGSGAIALSLATETHAEVYAVERDEIPFEAATSNCGEHVTVIRGDATEPIESLRDLEGTFDVVVSNPPYVPASQVSVEATFDPPAALWGRGDNGLEIPKKILDRAAVYCRPGGFVAIEHDPGQAEALLEYARSLGFESRTVCDLTGRPRFATGYLSM